MRAGLTICAMVIGCNYPPLPAITGDANGDADGAAPAAGCFPHWLDGTVRIAASSIEELTGLTTPGEERDPWISRDGLRLYFSRDPGTFGLYDLYLATRSSTAEPFVDPVNLVNLNTGDNDRRPSLTTDETMIALMSDRQPTAYRVFVATRPDATISFASPDQRHLGSVNTGSTDRFDPSVNGDALRLYLAPAIGPAGRQELQFAARATRDSDFAAPVAIPGIDGSNISNADPSLSPDERVLVFSSDRANPGLISELFYATRPDPSAAFGPPQPIPSVNSGGDDVDPRLSADGCELYFTSTRDGDKYHLFHAAIAK